MSSTDLDINRISGSYLCRSLFEETHSSHSSFMWPVVFGSVSRGTQNQIVMSTLLLGILQMHLGRCAPQQDNIPKTTIGNAGCGGWCNVGLAVSLLSKSFNMLTHRSYVEYQDHMRDISWEEDTRGTIYADKESFRNYVLRTANVALNQGAQRKSNVKRNH